jgi:hypothetical protein
MTYLQVGVAHDGGPGVHELSHVHTCIEYIGVVSVVSVYKCVYYCDT